ncbi:hypothetical protein SCHPADRAFT_937884 [Schizopora paradoxa]|uniref:Uncharacterized protein n=1 Tax=Schizopora paradoxa TaxID=27342 RepID=A0A0H2RWY5_9AGAM|nr:hypothetical protein SCHPADRAFT_937884 [Schizopora paradoxa]
MHMTTTAVTSFLWSVVQKLWVFCPVLLPTILAYVALAPVSLKVWIGAQFAPRRNKHRDNTSDLIPSFLYPHQETIVLAVFLIVATLVDIFVKEVPVMKALIMFVILNFPGGYSVSRLPVRNHNLVIGRFKEGAPFFYQMKEEETLVFNTCACIAAFIVCFGAMLYEPHTFLRDLCQVVLYGSFLHLLLLGTAVPMSRVSREERRPKDNLVAGMIGGTICIAVVAGAIFYMGRRDGPFVLSDEDSVLVHANVSWYWSMICFEIIALCYKMDYTFAQESGHVKVPDLKLRQPEGEKSDTSTDRTQQYVVRIPTSFQPSFDKPYFYASLAGLIAAAVFLACFITCLEAMGRTILGYEWVRFYLSAVAAPFVCAFPMALAYRKREFKKVWGYRERWMDIPDLPVRVPFAVSSEEKSTDTESTDSAAGIELCDEESILREEKDKEQVDLV